MIEIQGYKIVRPLGKGGMSTLYLAVQVSVNRQVALKVMSPVLASDEAYAERFLREARMAARLRHPNIISVLDVNMANGLPYIATEYAMGGSLDEARVKSMGLQEKLRVLSEVSDALGFLHQQNVLHRDIKPNNILFREDGTAVLTDFGLSIDRGSDSGVTLAGDLLGTPHYMSPEQALGATFDARADIYSLGVVVFWMLSGRVPFTAENAIGICQKHVHEPVPNLPPEHARFNYAVKKAMAKSPRDRYATASEFFNDLRSAAETDTPRVPEVSKKVATVPATESGNDEEATLLQPHTGSTTRQTRIEPTFGQPGSQPKTGARLGTPSVPGRSPAPTRQDRAGSGRFLPVFRDRPLLAWSGLAGIAMALVVVVMVLRGWSPEEIPPAPSQPVDHGLLERVEGQPVQAADDRATEAVEPLERPFEPAPPSADELAIQGLLAQGREAMATLGTVGQEGHSPSRDFREVLTRDPGNVEALQALDTLASRLFFMAESIIESPDNESVGWMLEEIRLTGRGDAARLAGLDQRYRELTERVEQPGPDLRALFDQGYAYLESGNLTEPADANALVVFQQILTLEPGNAEATEGVRQIAKRFLELANQAVEQGNWTKAEAHWQRSNKIAPSLSGADELRRMLDQHQQEVVVQPPAPIKTPTPAAISTPPSTAGLPPGEIAVYTFEKLNLDGNESASDLFELAESQLDSGNDLRAYALYLEVVRKDSAHAGARKRLSRGAGVYLKYADRDLLEGDLDSAYANLQIALSLDANDVKADSVRRAYLAAREDQIIKASLANNGSSDLEMMQINLRLEEAKSNYSRFQSDPANHVAATRALENYRQILHLQSDHPAARAGLDALCDALISASQNAFDQGKTGDAFWFYKNALEINPNNPRLKQLESQLN